MTRSNGSTAGLRDALDAGLRGVQAERRHGQRHEHGARGDGRDDRMAQDAVEDRAPDAAVALLAAEAVHERDPALLDPVAELARARPAGR